MKHVLPLHHQPRSVSKVRSCQQAHVYSYTSRKTVKRRTPTQFLLQMLVLVLLILLTALFIALCVLETWRIAGQDLSLYIRVRRVNYVYLEPKVEAQSESEASTPHRLSLETYGFNNGTLSFSV